MCPCFNAMILIVGISPDRTLLRNKGTIQKQIFELPPSLCNPRFTFQSCFGVLWQNCTSVFKALAKNQNWPAGQTITADVI